MDDYAHRTLTLGTPDKQVTFAIEDLCRHSIIFGSSGSGKTTRAFNPMLQEMLTNLGAGALVIAVKPEAVVEICEIAKRAGREALVITPGGETGIDLLTGSPDVDSMYFRDTFGRVGDESKVWVDAAVARMKNALRMLKAAGNQYYTFDHLTQYCFDDQFAAMVRIQAMERLRALPHEADDAWTIREAMSYEDTRYRDFTPETRRAVQFSVSQLLEPMRDVHIAKTFARRHNLVPIESVFDGKVIVMHVPRTQYERAAHAIYTLAKRRFFTALERRRGDPNLDQDRPVVFGVDEYQLCISESDVQSLGVIRSAGCMVLATTQGVSSLYSVLPQHVVDAALQNFTQKMFFKTDDHDTLAVLQRAMAQLGTQFESRQLFSMNRNQALCHLTIGDDTVDTVLTLTPIFITPDYLHSSYSLAEA